MRLTKAEREQVRVMFDGRCAYCGEPLGSSWHADHREPVHRELTWERGKGFVATGRLLCPEHDRLGNIMPACRPCNIDKGGASLEDWRGKLARSAEVLARNNSTYRHAVRFGLVRVLAEPVIFYFERGTADCVRQARAAGVEVREITP